MTSTQQPSAIDQPTTPFGIWGGGLIGLSTAAHLARKGVNTIIIDINDNQVSRINAAQFPPNFESWIGFPAEHYIKCGLIRATTDVSQLLLSSVNTHFIAVPTECNGEPYMEAIETVLSQIKEMFPYLCIIESTLIPGQTDSLGRMYGLPIGVATRRDWFTASENNLENCFRIYSGISDDISEKMEAVLSITCKRLHCATSCSVVELTKCLDNGIFHSMAMYASQVALAYPHINVAESLKLAATHWRLGNHVYFPSIGTGGPCVPLANKYLLLGARHSETLSIATDAVRYDSYSPIKVAALMKKQLKPGDRVAVLGICYRGDIRVHIESPHLKLAHELIRLGVDVGVHDPYYTKEELCAITGGTAFGFPNDLGGFQFVYVGANHEAYTKKTSTILSHLIPGQVILDNQGIWEAIADDARSLGISYRRVGGPNWTTTKLEEEESGQGLFFEQGSKQNQNIVYENEWFRIRTATDKTLSPKPYFILDRPDSTIIIPVSTSYRFLLQKQYRPHVARQSWEFPMGSIDAGETPKEAAHRELLEETGLSCSNTQPLATFYPIPGLASQRSHIFLAHITDEELDAKHYPNLSEGILAFQVVTAQILQSMIASNKIFDGFTLAAWSLFNAGSAELSNVCSSD
ncbi:hypothetical protein H9Q69_012675 [Fusarium xylarioides]|uniref:Nudix hydrolase domain-containing protein n=1 Tax=Fusarium xylarioides TaxID=221167 RepID=A0A9P7HJS9_9HYPO|nr:hypothetical protein H9Q70_013146 [Fusarium xylarioides]KAG5760873.1 hypothetical protein H9Q72_011015 [Fusarium xylarioides]KAG5770041.1 hypothetical protein H9Q73_013365 [Fusarium xylarioides]KAG5788259.1 hypothetical protein H9Q69_012675 [Fusarium xylarioides]